MKTTYKVGDSFWLIPAPYNPIAVKVKVLEVELDKGYWVDEPVGLVNNIKCICDSAEAATEVLKLIHEQGGEKVINSDKWDLEGFRGFMLDTASKTSHPDVAKVLSGVYPPKAQGEEWFKLS